MGQSELKLKGSLQMEVVRPSGIREVSLREVLRLGMPRLGLPQEVNEWRTKNLGQTRRGLADVWHARRSRAPVLLGFLYLRKICADGRVLDLGLASTRFVTTAWVNYLVDALQNQTTSPIDIFHYHGLGLGTNAEAVGDTALQTELTTQYSTDSVRANGSVGEGATANVFRTVGSNTVDASVAITEHGVFSDPDVGQGTLLDRSVFAAVNLLSSETLQTTYDLTCTAGG